MSTRDSLKDLDHRSQLAREPAETALRSITSLDFHRVTRYGKVSLERTRVRRIIVLLEQLCDECIPIARGSHGTPACDRRLALQLGKRSQAVRKQRRRGEVVRVFLLEQ